jgi:hypothetical protein
MQGTGNLTTNRNAGHRVYMGTQLFHGTKLGSVGPQAKKLYGLMERDRYVTRLTAMHYGVANVTARVAELRAAGINISCEVAKDADGREYGRWFIGQ